MSNGSRDGLYPSLQSGGNNRRAAERYELGERPPSGPWTAAVRIGDEESAKHYHREVRDWYTLFKAYDTENRGYIPVREFRHKIEQTGDAYGLSAKHRAELLKDSDQNEDKRIDFEEFCYMMSRAKSLRSRGILFRAAQAVVPRSQREEIFSELQEYNCMPPPFFMIFATIIEIIFYVYYLVDMNAGISVSGPVPLHSPLIYDPYRRFQAWRFLSYMLVHIGIYHILFNCLTQLALGIPLELVHKYWRIGIVYLVGVIAGSLAVSFTDPKVYLAGASGGVYALISAHAANLLVNWSEMEFNWIRLIFLTVLVGTDFGVALYNRYAGTDGENNVSYVAHIGGFLAGLLMGIVVLRNFKQRNWERIVWWIALVGGIMLFLLCICWNIWYPQYPASCFDPPFRPKQGPNCASNRGQRPF